MSALPAVETAPLLEVVVPVHEEEAALPRAVATLTYARSWAYAPVASEA